MIARLMMARLTDGSDGCSAGTAMAETAVCSWCITANEGNLALDTEGLVDCTGNDALECQNCGWDGVRVDPEPDDPGLEIVSLLILSTDHLPIDTWLGTGERVNPNSLQGVTSYDLPNGFLVWVGNDPAIGPPAGRLAEYLVAEELSGESAGLSEVVDVLTYAWNHGCAYVLFDRDGNTIDALPTYEE